MILVDLPANRGRCVLPEKPKPTAHKTHLILKTEGCEFAFFIFP